VGQTCGFHLSPDEHFVIYYDPARQDYMSFETGTGVTRSITGGMAIDWKMGGRG